MKPLVFLFICLSLFLFARDCEAHEILFGGDITLTRNINPSQDRFFSKQAKQRIGEADLFIWNAEFSGKSEHPKQKRFVFSCDSDIVRHIKFPNGVATIANNHSFDGGQEGFGNLVKSLMKYDMPYVGLRNFETGRNFLSATVDGKRYYILNFSPMIERTPMPFATPSWEDIKSSLRFLKSVKNPEDRVIVCIHDGVEGTKEISQRQKQIVNELINLGIDIIAYTHTHTYIEPEKIGNTLVLWGLGNFIFGGNSRWRDNNDVRMISVNPETLEWKWINGRTRDYVFSFK